MTTFTTEVPRDRFGRPMVMLPDGSKRMAYRRCTTFVGATDETYNLQKWKMRQVAKGLAARQDLILGVGAADPNDKKTLDQLCEQALDASQSSAKATIGTALHSYTERADQGLDISDIPAPYDKDVEAYMRATRELEMTAIETFRVYDSWQVAGTADRIVRYKGRSYVADVKTGSIDFSGLKFAAQIALYAKAVAYVDDQRVPDVEPVDQTRGVIIHLPAGTGTCTLHWVNLEHGWRACQTAKRVWDERALKKELMWPLEEPANPVVLSNDWAAISADRAAHAQTIDELRAIWVEVANSPGGLTDEFRQAVDERRARLA